MTHSIKKLITLTIIFTFFMNGTVFAEEPDTKTKLEETKETINELVEAKDENSPFDISLRIKTFKKVIELSISETKDLKISLIAINNIEENLKNWQNTIIEKLNKISEYYKNTLEEIENKESLLTLEEIKINAADFKTWREKNYLPIQNKTQDLFLIKNEKKALEISNKRIEKINNDLKILKNAGIKDADKLTKMFNDAKNFIKNAENDNKEASQMFIKQYGAKKTQTATSTTETTTSTENVASSTIQETTTSTENVASSTIQETTLTPENSTTSTATSTISATSTIESSTSTESNKLTATSTKISTSTIESNELNDDSNKSIRGLISSSWDNIKSAYQIFIEMSGFVRKSLE